MAEKVHIFPMDEGKIIQRPEKEEFLKQKAKVIWFSGLSGSGKSTLASQLERNLFENGYLTQILDGDNIRAGINNNLTFSKEDRIENLRRVAEVSRLFLNCGIICINSFITPREEMRELVRSVVGKENYIEVYIKASIEACESRDVKGLYKKARNGEIKNFTGIDAPFEAPLHPDIVIDTDKCSIEEGVKKLLEYILPIVKYN